MKVSVRVIPCKNKGKKGQRQQVPFLWRNMKEYRVIRIFFAVSSISFVFRTILAIFILILKNGPFKKNAYWKIDFVIEFVIVGRDKFNRYLRYSKLYDF